MTHVLFNLDSADWPDEWEPLPAENVISGTPTGRTIELGEFRGGPIGIWQLSPSRAGGVGDEPELIVILGGDSTLHVGDEPGVDFSAGTVFRVDHGTRDDFEVRETLTEFYFYPSIGGANEGAVVSRVTDDLDPVTFFSQEQTGGAAISTSLLQSGSIEGVGYGFWEMGVGSAQWTSTDEIFIVHSGRGVLHVAEGEDIELQPGTIVRVTEGDQCRWQITETLRKVWIG